MRPQPWSIKGQRPLSGWRSIVSLRVPWLRLDWPILLLGIVLVGLGLVFVREITAFDLTYGRATAPMEVKLKKAAVAVPALLLGLLLRPRWIRRNAYLLYGITIVLLLLVPIIGDARNGARRWIQLPGGFDLQPSELAKLGLIVALARGLYRTRLARWREWVVPATLTFLPIALVAAQPDLGTALTIVPVSLGMLWLAGARTRTLLGLMIVGAVLGLSAWQFEWVQGYQKKRIDIWARCLDNETLIANRNGAAFHPYMARVMIGNGARLGTGFGGVANQTGHLPEDESDSIFAVIAEEGGFVGATTLVATYLLFCGLLVVSAARTRERFSRLVIAGSGLYFAAHFGINAGVNLGLLPMTGLPMPLISAGGSSLMASLALLGLALGLSARAEPTLDSDSFRE
jgi:rod shape determining protein RodA